MLSVRVAATSELPAVVALPVSPGENNSGVELTTTAVPVPNGLATECTGLLAQTAHTGRAGAVQAQPRPGSRPHHVLLVGIGAGTEADWRAAGAALARAAVRQPELTVALPLDADPAAIRGVAEGLRLASYRFRLGADAPEQAPRLAEVTLAVDDPSRYESVLAVATAVTEATALARELTNQPSNRKNPAWFVDRIAQAAGALPGVRLRVWDETALQRDGFGGIMAVGGGSAQPPRLLQISWEPPAADRHVVLVGKGITFDTGGVSIKPVSGMKLMRKDMAGAAAVCAAALGAAELRLPVRVTALVALAENMPSGSAQRPGDVVRHWDGRTSEVRNTDAEGRLVLADALAYAAAELAPDTLVDLATLTGANAVALGARTAALYTEDDALAEALIGAATEAGERVWRMPLVEDYTEAVHSDIADLNNSPEIGAGSVTAALYLREFTGAARGRWVHLDMSAPSWIDRDEGELTRGATGWGVRTLLRWLAALPT